MSSHREAPEISKDPVADNTDTYAFVSPDKPDTVTIITNYIPLEDPPGGPNFFEFGDDVLYSIYIDNDGDGKPDIEYRFKFKTKLRNPNTFLYNTGPISGARQPELEPAPVLRRQPGRSRRAHKRSRSPRCSAATSPCPPCNIGPRSTPNYQAALAEPAVHSLESGEEVFAGQRNEGFFVDLGSIFDLGDLRPLQNLHLIADGAGDGRRRDGDAQRPHDRDPGADQGADPRRLGPDRTRWAAKAVLGIWGARQPAQDAGARPGERTSAPSPGRGSRSRAWATRCSTRSSCRWARRTSGTRCIRRTTRQFAKYVEHPELAKLLPVLYPGVFPNLAALQGEAGRPGGDPAHRASRAGSSRGSRTTPGTVAGGHAAAERRDPADDVEPEPARPARRRPGRVPERPPRVRRRGQHRAAGGRRRSPIRWSTRATRRMPRLGDADPGTDAGPGRYQSTFPYLGHAARRVRHAVGADEPQPPHTPTPTARIRSTWCWTSAGSTGR